jgi:hypothetical protein
MIGNWKVPPLDAIDRRFHAALLARLRARPAFIGAGHWPVPVFGRLAQAIDAADARTLAAIPPRYPTLRPACRADERTFFQ